MAAATIASGVGLRHVRVWLLDTAGYPDGDQSGTVTGYDGIRVEGVKSFQGNIPDVQTLTHTGDDRPFAQDSLPATTIETATITTGKTNLTLDAALRGESIHNIGDLQIDGMGTDSQGFEAQVCVYGWRQALKTGDGDAAYGARQYITHFYPSARLVPKGAGMSEGQTDENGYNLTATVVNKYPWGLAFSEVNNGFTEAVKLRVISDNPLMMERFTGDGTAVNFHLTYAPISTAKTLAYSNGTAATVSAVNTTTYYATLSAAPTNGAKVVFLYETTGLT